MGALCPGMRWGEDGVDRGPACYGLVATGWSSRLDLSRYRPELRRGPPWGRLAGVFDSYNTFYVNWKAPPEQVSPAGLIIVGIG